MKIGTDILTARVKQYLNKKHRIALLCNQASVNSKFEHIADILINNKIKPTYIFSPEHGLYGVFQDMIKVKEINQYRGIPVISLYGDSIESLAPGENILKNVDTIIIDLFDIGTRFYTFAATMFLLMKKASGKEIRFIICDRPNPIGGQQIEGNGVEDKFKSFVGIANIPVRHSLTIGELAIFFNEVENINVPLTIIKICGYDRNRYLDTYSNFFIPPSPNMPSLNTAIVYPMGCLFEGTNISEGRGTTRPFELFGADFIDPFVLSKELNKLGLEGVFFRPTFFMPKFHKYADKTIGGIFVHITERKKFRPYTTGISILHTIRKIYGEQLKWREEPYEFVSDRLAIDLLFGNDKIRNMIDKQINLKTIVDFVKTEEATMVKEIKKFYIYE
ncbi:MAG: DUF1343 domain-containing protein [Deltaproteobacteria bacterium]|nr:DUF1343 domain-containing protein [Deltaproteobacteria bacterium]